MYFHQRATRTPQTKRKEKAKQAIEHFQRSSQGGGDFILYISFKKTVDI